MSDSRYRVGWDLADGVEHWVVLRFDDDGKVTLVGEGTWKPGDKQAAEAATADVLRRMLARYTPKASPGRSTRSRYSRNGKR